MKENIKLALMGLIAVTLIINTFMKGGNSVDNSDVSARVSGDANINPVMPADNPDLMPNEPLVPSGPKTQVVFETYDHDFGDIKQDTENEKIFSFKNTGKEPLLITSANGSCGCTVPEYPKQPIAPGATGDIKVIYSPGKQEFKQTKSVTITANTDPETTVLKIYANVLPGNTTPQ